MIKSCQGIRNPPPPKKKKKKKKYTHRKYLAF